MCVGWGGGRGGMAVRRDCCISWVSSLVLFQQCTTFKLAIFNPFSYLLCVKVLGKWQLV